ncbi:MAG: TMEM175 family protein, partial [Longimicrobiales bacterium]
MSLLSSDVAREDWRPDRNGFRVRGSEMTRTETFTDAAFAFAVTLLVISVDAVPSSFVELRAALAGIPAFAASFVLLWVFWYGHWQWSRRFGLEDLPTIQLSFGLVFVMLSYVYPMKFLATLSVAFLSGNLEGGAMLTNADQLYQLFAIYGIGFVTMALIIVALNVHA